MTESIVEYLRDLAATIGGIETSHCLAERRSISSDEPTEMPYLYTQGGGYVPVEVDSGSVSYFRLVNPISFDEVDGRTPVKALKGSYPFTFVAMVRRDDNNPLTYSQDVANLFEGRNKDLATILKASSVHITVTSIETDTTKIWQQEFQVPVTTPNYTRSMVMIELTVEVVASRDCWVNCADYPDILQGFPWCPETAATLARLTSAQVDCVTEELCGVSDPVTEQINGTTIGTAASGSTNNQLIQDSAGANVGTGANPSVISDSTNELNGVDISDPTVAEGTHDQEIKNSAATPIGSAANPSVIADGQMQVNGANTETVAATVTHNQSVHDSAGVDVGTAANPSVISDATVRNNATPTFTDTVEAEGTLTLAQGKMLDSDGTTTVLSDYIPASSGFMFTATPSTAAPSVAVGVDNTTPNTDTVVTITATPTDITPTSYRFYADNGSEFHFIAEQASNVYAWTCNAKNGSWEIFVEATDGTDTCYNETGVAITVTGRLLDRFSNASFCWSLTKRGVDFCNSLLLIRRSSDNVQQWFGFLADGSFDSAGILTFVGANDGSVVCWVSQALMGNLAYQGTASRQPKIVISGALVVGDDGNAAIDFDGVDDHLEITIAASFASGFFLAQNNSISARLVQPVIGGTSRDVTWGGGAVTGIRAKDDAGTNITTTTEDTASHTVSVFSITNDGVYVDGMTDTATGTFTTFSDFTNIGFRPDGSFYMDGLIQDVIGFSDDKWSDKANIEAYL